MIIITNTYDVLFMHYDVTANIPKPSRTGIPTGMGVDFLPVSKQDSKEGRSQR